jgi:hypothetical protein
MGSASEKGVFLATQSATSVLSQVSLELVCKKRAAVATVNETSPVS